MLLTFAEKPLTGLVFSALLVGIVSYFGQAEVFDPIMTLAFFAIAVAFRRNIDLLSIALICFLPRAIEEVMWRILDDNLWHKIPCYAVCLLLAWSLTNTKMRSVLLVFTTVGVFIEIYWWLSDYAAPNMVWSFYILSVLIVTRKLFKSRVFWLIELNPKIVPKLLPLDSQMLLANTFFISLLCIFIVEYWIRHLFGLPELTPVYRLYPYLVHTATSFVLYMIIIESIQHLKKLELNA